MAVPICRGRRAARVPIESVAVMVVREVRELDEDIESGLNVADGIVRCRSAFDAKGLIEQRTGSCQPLSVSRG